MRREYILILLIVTLASALRTPAQATQHTLRKTKEYDLPGPPGKRFDYLTIDTDDGYLISAHLAANKTYVIDLHTDKVLATVTDTPAAEGVEYVPEFKKCYTSNAGDNTIGVVDMKQTKVVKKLKQRASRTEARMPLPITSCTYPMNEEKPKQLSTLPTMKSPRLCISTVKQGCPNTIRLRARCT